MLESATKCYFFEFRKVICPFLSSFLFLIGLSIALIHCPLANSQELNCQVSVKLSPKLAASDRSIYEDMEKTIQNFMNSTKWTDDEFDAHEKIEANLVIFIESRPTNNSFTASGNIQIARPVFNTNYNSIVLNLSRNYADKDFDFSYVISQPLNFTENTYQNELSAILAFYAYEILAVDFDTFSELGGTKLHEKAQEIVNQAQQRGSGGWIQFTNPPRNRYWLNENFTSKQLEPLRKALYEYHRLGMDLMSSDEAAARNAILGALQKIKQVHQIRNSTFFVPLFLDSKQNELISIFSKGDLSVRRRAYNLLVQMQPTKQTEYRKMLQ